MYPRNVRLVNVTGLENNMKAIRASLPSHVRIMAVVKADGYGHGAAEASAAALQGGADMLAVASVQEGIALREAGIRAPVLVIGAVTEADVLDGVKYDLIQTVCSGPMIEWCESAAANLKKQTEVHLKVDTGMGRIGIRNAEEREQILETLNRCPHIRLSGVFTHFSDADGDDDGILYTRNQFQKFLDLTAVFPKEVIRHCCNSAAIHRFPEMAMDMVRAGISFYGYPPVKTELNLQPCMTWTAKISYVKDLSAGSFISYGRTYRSPRNIRVATITCGYGDGYHRAAGRQGYVLIHGQRAKIIGRICMDQMMADVTDIPDAAPGDEVVLIGRSGEEMITAEDIARWAGTISYEILLSVGSRVDRITCK